MELDEMKNTWNTLDKRLNKMLHLQDSLIREVMQTKVNKSITLLRNWEIFGAIVVTLLIPFIVYVYLTRNNGLLSWNILLVVSGIASVGLSFWQAYKVQCLMKVDYSRSISENVYYINRYKIWYEKEKMAMSFVIGPVLAILLVVYYAQLNASLPHWVLLFSILLCTTVYCYWSYKTIIKQKIPSIVRSLEELKEISEE